MVFQIGGKTPAAAASDERHAVGTGDDGAELGPWLSVEQAVCERDLPGAIRVCGPVERVRVHVSRADSFRGTICPEKRRDVSNYTHQTHYIR